LEIYPLNFLIINQKENFKVGAKENPQGSLLLILLIFYPLSNALSSSEFHSETVVLLSLDEVRKYQCFFWNLAARCEAS